MKRILLVPALCLVLFAACKKDENQSKGSKETVIKYPVSFDLSGFSKTIGTMSSPEKSHQTLALTATDSLKLATTNLMYVVYDSNGNQVNRLSQLASAPTNTYKLLNTGAKLIKTTGIYGQLVDSLAVGTYTVVLAGSNKPLSLNTPDDVRSTAGTNQFFPTLPIQTSTIYFTSNDKPGDLFYYKGTITVIPGNNTTQKLTLSRIVGQLALNIEDAIPTSANHMSISVVNDNSGYKINTNSPTGTSTSKQYDITFTAADKGKLNYTYAIYALNTITPNISLSIKVYDSQDNLLVSKTIPSISVKANQKTTLTGKLFGASSSFIINVSPDWGLTGTTINF